MSHARSNRISDSETGHARLQRRHKRRHKGTIHQEREGGLLVGLVDSVSLGPRVVVFRIVRSELVLYTCEERQLK